MIYNTCATCTHAHFVNWKPSPIRCANPEALDINYITGEMHSKHPVLVRRYDPICPKWEQRAPEPPGFFKRLFGGRKEKK